MYCRLSLKISSLLFQLCDSRTEPVKDGSRRTDWTERLLCQTGFDGEAEWMPSSEEGYWGKHFSWFQKVSESHSGCDQNGSLPWRILTPLIILQALRGEVKRFFVLWAKYLHNSADVSKQPSAGLTEKQNRETPEIIEKWNEMAISKSTNWH